MLERQAAPDGRVSLCIRANGPGPGTWRTRILLEKGRYRFVGTVRTTGIENLGGGKNKGAALRVLGVRGAQPGYVIGNADWTPLSLEFEVVPPTHEVELLCEFRGVRGVAWFALDSLRLVRVKD
jgi:hypothetical protein